MMERKPPGPPPLAPWLPYRLQQPERRRPRPPTALEQAFSFVITPMDNLNCGWTIPLIPWESCHPEATSGNKTEATPNCWYCKMSETKSSHPKSYRDHPSAIAEYLSAAFARNDLRTTLESINVVMRAQNVLALAEAMGIRREPLYRSFGGNIDPFFGRVLALLRALDVQLTVTPWPPNSEPKSAAFKGFRDNPVAIARHLNKAFDSNERRTILEAINSVMRAQNVMALAKVSGLGREKLYKSFGGRIDPHFSRVIALLAALGVQFQLKALKPTKKSPRPKLGRPPKGVQKGNNVVGRRRPRT